VIRNGSVSTSQTGNHTNPSFKQLSRDPSVDPIAKHQRSDQEESPSNSKKKRKRRKTEPTQESLLNDSESNDVPVSLKQPKDSKRTEPTQESLLNESESNDVSVSLKQPKGGKRTATKIAGDNKAPASSSTTTPLSLEAATSVRRIQGEWKDAVKAGIAYDWKKGIPVRPKGSYSIPQHAQHVWLSFRLSTASCENDGGEPFS
jgi:hypothetical protein